MSEMAVPESKPEKLTTLNISKEQATDLKVDKAVRFEVVGEVKEIRQCYNDKEHYEVVLKDAQVEASDQAEEKDEKPEEKDMEEKAGEEKDSKDSKDSEKETYATMPKEKLKKVIMVREVEE